MKQSKAWILLALNLALAGCMQESVDTSQAQVQKEQNIEEQNAAKTVPEDQKSAELNDNPNTETQEKTVELTVESKVQETNYYCTVTCIQMILDLYSTEMSQDELAEQLGSTPGYGTDYISASRVLDLYFPDVYQLQWLESGNFTDEEYALFEQRVLDSLDAGYPLILAIDLHTMYPDFSHADHDILCIGYQLDENGAVENYIYLDPYYNVLDENGSGYKIVDAQSMRQAMQADTEAAYIYAKSNQDQSE